MEGYQMFTIFVPKKAKVAAVDKKVAEPADKKAEKSEPEKKEVKKAPAKAKPEPKDDDEIF